MLEFLEDPPLEISILLSSDLEKKFRLVLYFFDSIPNVIKELDPLPNELEQRLEPDEVDPISKENKLAFSFCKDGKEAGPENDPLDIEDPKGPFDIENTVELPKEGLVP